MGLTRANARILVADDSPEDLFFLARAFERAGLGHSLVTVQDGEKAIEYLESEPRPDLLLLDLKMPKRDGFDVLQWIQSKPELRDLPVVVFSSSDLIGDKERAKELGAKDYLVKSPDLEAVVVELDTKFLRKSPPL